MGPIAEWLNVVKKRERIASQRSKVMIPHPIQDEIITQGDTQSPPRPPYGA